MAEFTSHAPGSPSWIDLMTPDTDASKAFYGELFGWQCEDQFDGDGNRIYTMARVDGKAVAGMGSPPPGAPEMPAVWNNYVTVEDAQACTQKVEASGGSVIMPAMQVMESGTMAVCADPTGAAFSVWQPAGHIGAELCNVPNTWSWSELSTRDIDTAKSFYSQVFDWSYEGMETPAGTYNVIAGGENGGWGGMMQMPAEVPQMVPNHWAVYFTVADFEASAAKATELGAQPVMEPMQMPGIGTMCMFHDPVGAAFYLMEPETPSQ